MTDRPAIPANIQRAILVEAGHRCAIPTCKYPKAEIHHIIPWEKCKQHEFENLIALCPNCHTRADRDEIDRKSLRMYKVRLSSSAGITDPAIEKTEDHEHNAKHDNAAWSTKNIKEKGGALSVYEFNAEIPEFNDADLSEINLLLSAWAFGELQQLRTVAHPEDKINTYSGLPSTFSASYEVSLYSQSLLSIKVSAIEYGSGAAHSSPTTHVFNFCRNPVIPISLQSLFIENERFLVELSKFTRSFLSSVDPSSELKDWIHRGTKPDLKNFETFNLLKEGLLITFGVYQVNCYAAGDQHVIIPYQYLQPVLKPGHPVCDLFAL